MDYAKQYQEYLARANQALEKACDRVCLDKSGGDMLPSHYK